MDFDDDLRPEDLFEEDNNEVENEAPESAAANLELGSKDGQKEEGKKEPAAKRIVRNPQPKLDPDRILGSRGIAILPEVFADFRPHDGRVFEDLEVAMKKMEHWAHRLYPKLPFDDVMARVSQLGKKKAVQTNIKKIRLGMATFIPRSNEEIRDDDEDQQVEDETKRYDNEFPTEDVFEQLVREAEEAARPQPTVLTEQQKERMMRNRQMAEEKRLAKQRAKDQEEREALHDMESIDNVEIRQEDVLSQVFNNPNNSSSTTITENTEA